MSPERRGRIAAATTSKCLADESCFNVRRMIHVRLAVAADGDAIGEVEVETWRVAYAGLILVETIAGFDAEPRKQMWRDGLAREHKAGTAVFVAEGDGGVVGFAWVGASRDEAGSAELYAIYLHPASWGTGVGRACSSVRRSRCASQGSWMRCYG